MNAINYYERGTREPMVAQLRKIADALGVSMDDIDLPTVQRQERTEDGA